MRFPSPSESNIKNVNLEPHEKSPVDLAREILGPDNVFDVEDAEHYFGLTPTEADRQALATIPFSEAELRECKDTHILTAILPISPSVKNPASCLHPEGETG